MRAKKASKRKTGTNYDRAGLVQDINETEPVTET